MIWVLGSQGLLGKELVRRIAKSGMRCVSSDKDVDITKIDALERFISSTEASSASPFGGGDRIKWIINCAAYTDIDAAQMNEADAMAVNSEGALNVARVSRAKGIRLIHISTNQVFDGKLGRPYTEEDEVSPINAYGRTKAAGEENVAKEMTQFYILRTAALYGYDKDNFVIKMIRLMNESPAVKVQSGQKVCPTFAGDAADAVIHLMQKADGAKTLFGKDSPAPYGTYHYCATGAVSMAECSCAIGEIAFKAGLIARECQVLPCNSAEADAGEAEGGTTERPMNGEMDTTKIAKALKLRIPSWKSRLEAFIKNSSHRAAK